MIRTLRKRNIRIKIYDIKPLLIISVTVIIVSVAIVPLYEQYAIRWGILFVIIMAFFIKRNSVTRFIKNIFGK